MSSQKIVFCPDPDKVGGLFCRNVTLHVVLICPGGYMGSGQGCEEAVRLE